MFFTLNVFLILWASLYPQHVPSGDDRIRLHSRCELGGINLNKGSLESTLRDRYEKLKEIVLELQSSLPLDMKIPPCHLPVKTKLLDWLEAQKDKLEKLNCWKEIIPLRKKLVVACEQVDDTYKYFFKDQTKAYKIEKNYSEIIWNILNTLGTGESHAQASTKQLEIRIGAFSTALFKRMCSSNIFYPTKYETEQNSSPSLAASRRSLFADRKKIQESLLWSVGKRSLSFVARGVAFSTIGILAAPMGVLYHSLQTGRCYVQYKLQDNEKSHANWRNVSAHLSALWTDFSFILTAGHVCPINLSQKNSLKVIPAVALLSPFISFFGTFYPARSFVPYFTADEDKRAALFKSIVIREHFGYSTRHEDFSSYDPLLDSRMTFQGFDEGLLHLWIDCSIDMITTLRKIYVRLSLEDKISFDLYIGDRSIDIESIVEMLKGKEDMSELLKQLQRESAQRLEAYDLLNECYVVTQKSALDNNITIKHIESRFPFTREETLRRLGRFAANPVSFWEETFDKERTVFIYFGSANTPHAARDSKYEERAVVLRKFMQPNTKIPSASELLGVESNASQKDIKKKYREDALFLHPDKAPEAHRAEADFFFKLVTKAKESLLEPTA